MATKYFIGLDLGKKQDPAAVAVVRGERADIDRTLMTLARMAPKPEALYTLVHVERVPLETPYHSIVRTVCALRHNPVFQQTLGEALPSVIEDAGGVGSVVSEMFKRAQAVPRDILTVPGAGYTRHPDGTHHVAKRRLVDILRVLAEARPVRLRLGERLADAPALRRELETFDETFRDTGHLTYSARVQEHDDMILALAYACWWAETWGWKEITTY